MDHYFYGVLHPFWSLKASVTIQYNCMEKSDHHIIKISLLYSTYERQSGLAQHRGE